MKSPFPGMDPYIEDCGLWPDFHDDSIAEIKRALAAHLPERYFVQLGERSYIVLADTEDKEERPFVVEPDANGTVTMRAFIDEHFRENFIEIYEADPEVRLVTCIEVLSPSNKRRGTEGWELYLRKRNALLLGQASLVEIDLLRGGQRMPMIEAWPNSPYYLLVGRQSRVPYCQVQRAHFRQPLPELSVPLASPDPDISLALQPLIDAVYERSRYGRRIDYTRPLTPPLDAEDAAWLGQQLQARAGSS